MYVLPGPRSVEAVKLTLRTFEMLIAMCDDFVCDCLPKKAFRTGVTHQSIRTFLESPN